MSGLNGSNGSAAAKAAAAFEAKLETTARQVEAMLDAVLPRPEGASAQLVEAMRYAVMGGGKRMRAHLTVEAARLTGGDPEQALRVAAAIECVHAYSLAHDDLPAMDDDDERRGKPSTHKAFDEATAILAGDALQSVAFEILSTPGASSDPLRRSDIILLLARAIGAGGMAGGQMIDLMAETRAERGEPPLTLEEIQILQAMKTGALIRAAALCGARLGQTTQDLARRLNRYGDRLGIAFQIRDDLIDVEGDAAEAGKALRKDEAAGKATFVSLLGVEDARALGIRMRDEAIETLSPFGPAAEGLREIANFALTRTR